MTSRRDPPAPLSLGGASAPPASPAFLSPTPPRFHFRRAAPSPSGVRPRRLPVIAAAGGGSPGGAARTAAPLPPAPGGGGPPAPGSRGAAPGGREERRGRPRPRGERGGGGARGGGSATPRRGAALWMAGRVLRRAAAAREAEELSALCRVPGRELRLRAQTRGPLVAGDEREKATSCRSSGIYRLRLA